MIRLSSPVCYLCFFYLSALRRKATIISAKPSTRALTYHFDLDSSLTTGDTRALDH